MLGPPRPQGNGPALTTPTSRGPLGVFATIGPLVLTNVLWFRSIHRIGANKATLAANLQPFVAAVLAVILLSEPLSWLQVAGGVLIAVGILAVRRRPRSRPVVLESEP